MEIEKESERGKERWKRAECHGGRDECQKDGIIQTN